MKRHYTESDAAASGVAHGINNELATIIGTADILLGEVEPDSEIGRGLKDILAAAIKMQELVRQMSCSVTV